MAKWLPKLAALSTSAPGPLLGAGIAVTLVTTAALAAMVISYPMIPVMAGLAGFYAKPALMSCHNY